MFHEKIQNVAYTTAIPPPDSKEPPPAYDKIPITDIDQV
jgi:hypothetical protein